MHILFQVLHIRPAFKEELLNCNLALVLLPIITEIQHKNDAFVVIA
jgi:hypothetical protein